MNGLPGYSDDDKSFLSEAVGKLGTGLDFDFESSIKECVLAGDFRSAETLRLMQETIPAAEESWKGQMDNVLKDFAVFVYGISPEVMVFTDLNHMTDRFLAGAQAALLIAFLRGWRCAEEKGD